ncbi:hypothetical protein V8C86DRAFT_2507689 [Haematococcus lacustris]
MLTTLLWMKSRTWSRNTIRPKLRHIAKSRWPARPRWAKARNFKTCSLATGIPRSGQPINRAPSPHLRNNWATPQRPAGLGHLRQPQPPSPGKALPPHGSIATQGNEAPATCVPAACHSTALSLALTQTPAPSHLPQWCPLPRPLLPLRLCCTSQPPLSAPHPSTPACHQRRRSPGLPWPRPLTVEPHWACKPCKRGGRPTLGTACLTLAPPPPLALGVLPGQERGQGMGRGSVACCTRHICPRPSTSSTSSSWQTTSDS